MALAAAINTVIIYAIYTPLHDSIHSSIFPRRKELRWVHTAVGMACAALLWMFYHHHRKSHFAHHAKSNTAEDPDLYAMGSFTRVFFAKIPWTLLNYFNPIAAAIANACGSASATANAASPWRSSRSTP